MLIMAAAYIISIFSSRTTIWDLSVNSFGTLQKSNSTNPFKQKKGKKRKKIEIKKDCITIFFPIHKHFVFIIISLQAYRQRQTSIYRIFGGTYEPTA